VPWRFWSSYLPSDKVYGQIYVPVVNWLMMMATVAITFAFGSSERLSGAYGTAVATTMLLTTILLLRAMRGIWHWPLLAVVVVGGSFLAVDADFFGANLLKIADGGWLPLVVALCIFTVMLTWRLGVTAIRSSLPLSPDAARQFLQARFGFFEIPDLQRSLREAQGLNADVDLDNVTFISTRDLVVYRSGSPLLRRWCLALFAFLYRNAARTIDRFRLPPKQVIELGREIEL
jgi:K+ transporter